MSTISSNLFKAKFLKPAPRYTSYPTAPEWGEIDHATYAQHLERLGDVPLSLYFHIPFCKTMCLYCGCSVVLNRRPENEERYVDYLMQEIDIVCSHLKRRQSVHQLHFGGGTPTKLSIPLFSRLFEKICSSFALDFSKEVAIEIDPRTVMEDRGKKLRFLKHLGFNRVSFGVQDTNEQVQEAVKRRQSYEMTRQTYLWARELGFKGINIDLIYGLPYQTTGTFCDTAEQILLLKPDRISLFSYAKVPWLKKHQNAIKEESLPPPEEKFQIYTEARARFIQEGYVAIGMDHFALESDEIAVSYHNKSLQRNFQGYSVKYAEEQLGFGVTAIGLVQGGYFQNLKQLPDYYAVLEQNNLPVCRGIVLSKEDHLRKWVIHTLMSSFALDKDLFAQKFGESFDAHFPHATSDLEKEGLVIDTPHVLQVTPPGELLIRNIAMVFDAYLEKPSLTPKFSQSI
ncbi:MAG: oxygen-independent coproporphyrinogen III oxidase [Chlamydiales bacterium]